MSANRNRWLVALSGVGIHISIGSVYAYSVMTLPLKEALGWQKSDITMAFSVAIVCLGLSAAFLGHFVEKHGPRASGMLAAICYGLGTIGAGLAVRFESLPMFIAAYGVLGGIGLGVGYITPVSTLVKWFPDKRGLATGMAIMGFGFAAMIFGPVMQKLFSTVGPSNTFLILGSVYFVVIFCSALYIAPPPKGWKPAQLDETEGVSKPKRVQREDLAQLTVFEAIRTKRFYFMWTMLFINITCGIALISVASPMAQEMAGMSAAAAAAMVGFMGLFNGIGRIGWASLSDYIGRPATYAAFFSIQIVAFFLLTKSPAPWQFQALVLLILTCYGGGFASVPAFLGDLFGTKQLGAIHGYTLTAWAAAGLVGPTLVTRVQEATGNYATTLYVFAGLFVLALAVTGLMALDIRAKRAAMGHTPPTAGPGVMGQPAAG
ncbi:L-lactate MFS transporter [Algisphaera agarilytica]|uniref:OFA family oxalate/formate antiporter-like MFS transporter n=1 Tax=Algisphaera agarilytica TaxID=1385975 RepID=A0A7X0LIH5_9BACT|nr:OFA family MFS transporter [Algisphaera agarilytica]MBB6428205.1 OFA family oxalate/formate antiporter-like MFS transporter [Algisphaera agarilytica]